MNTSRNLRFTLWCGLGFVAASAASWWLLKPYLQDVPPASETATVASGSMAPLLLGPHYLIYCRDCRRPYPVSAEQFPPDAVVCPICGKRQPVVQQEPVRGDLVAIDRDAFDDRPPQRWQVVAFRRTVDSAERWEVKRVVGMPGESVGIHHGDLFINGQPLQKTLENALAMAVLVHDMRFVTTNPQTPPRWRSEPAAQGNESGDSVELIYDHWRCSASPLPRTKPAPVMDSYGENQILSRELNFVRDLIVQCEATLPEEATLSLRLRTMGVVIEGRFEPKNGRAALLVDGAVKALKTLDRDPDGLATTTIHLAFLDGRAIFAVDGASLTALVEEPLDWEPSTSPVSVRVDGAKRECIENVALFRDIFYLHPNQSSQRWSTEIGDDQYLLLGDNAPISADGRHFGLIERKAIVGAVSKQP